MDGEPVNSKLCNERHARIDVRLEIVEKKMDKIDSRLIVALTTLVLNLVGIIVIVALTVSKG